MKLMPLNASQPLRLALDADVHVDAAEALRLRGFDAVSVRETGHEHLPDEDQLERAADQGRCIVTFNARHFRALHIRWLAEARDHGGIVVSPQISLREFIRRCTALLNPRSADMLRNQLIWLPRE
jgi:hypothetical protein